MTEESSIVECYQTLAQKPFESGYLYVDAAIDFPVEQVWAQAVHIGRWMTDHRLMTLAGRPGEVGHFEKVYSADADPQAPPPHFHFYGIAALVPLKCISLEVFPAKGGSYGDTRHWVMFDEILLTDLGSRTHVGVLMIEVDMSATTGAHGEQDPGTGWQEKARARMDRYLQNLREAVQAASNTSSIR
jgi:hypothetical protein